MAKKVKVHSIAIVVDLIFHMQVPSMEAPFHDKPELVSREGSINCYKTYDLILSISLGNMLH